MEHEMKLQPEYFDLIKSGIKTIEVRLCDEKRKLLKLGDVVKFIKEPRKIETLMAKVVELNCFRSFKELLKVVNVKDIGFDGWSKEEVVKLYRKFYSSSEELKYGVLAIKLNVLNEKIK